ncbi:MAG: InlB B-repeat-containing protein [Coriobacteriales bacterium]|nr:InlB B-repeat-containing protein [Coriobacteriales bacterium]
MKKQREPCGLLAILAVLLFVALTPVVARAEETVVSGSSSGSTELWVRGETGRGDAPSKAGAKESSQANSPGNSQQDSQIRQVVTSASNAVQAVPRTGDETWGRVVLAVALAVLAALLLVVSRFVRNRGTRRRGRHLAAILLLALVLSISATAGADEAMDVRGTTEGEIGTKRLLVSSDEEPQCGTVVSDYEGVWLVAFSTQDEAAQAMEELEDDAEFVVPDITFRVAGAEAQEDDDAEFDPGDGPVADLGAIGESMPAKGDVIALIDTGVTGFDERVTSRLSVIGSDAEDEHGHGTSMLREMVDTDPACRVVSIRAFDEQGVGTAASVYAAIKCAIDMGVKVINLSFCAPTSEGNAAVEQAIRDAWQAGIMVVGAAGNYGEDACGYVPGCIGAEAVIVGACDDAGDRLPQSNSGDTVDFYVPSPSTSVAAARASAWLCAHGEFGQELQSLEAWRETWKETGSQGEEEERPALEADSTAHSASTEEGPANQANGSDDTDDSEEGLSETTDASPSEEPTQDLAPAQDPVPATAPEPGEGPEALDDPVPSDHSGTTEDLQASQEPIPAGDTDVPADSSQGDSTTEAAEELPQGLEASLPDEPAPNQSPSNDLFRVSGTKYTLTVHTNGGVFISSSYGTTKFSSKELEYNESTYCEIDWLKPKRTGYTFAGWYTSASGGTMVYDKNGRCRKGTYWNRNYTNGSEVYIYNGNLTVYAHWTPLSYRQVVRVRYQQADGTYGEYSNVIDEDRDYDTTVSWSRSETATYEKASISYVVTGAKTTSVTVIRKKFTVAFNSNSGSGSMDNQSFYWSQSKALRANAFTRANYTFANWNTKANGSGTSYANKEVVSNIVSGGETITLYAQWEPKVYTITLNNQSASSAGTTAVYEKYATGVYLDSRCANAMTTTANRIAMPARLGYTFGGYYTEANGAGTQLISAGGYRRTQLTTTYFSQNSTLYAKWIANSYTIRYTANGGTGTMANQAVSNDAAGTKLRANQFQKAGNVFTGWALDSIPQEARNMASTSWWSIPSQVSASYDATQGKSTLTFSTVANAYENVTGVHPIRVVPGRTYTIKCSYRTVQAYTLASGSTWCGISIHSAPQGNAAVTDLLAHTTFSTSAMSARGTSSATFSVPTGVNTAYLSFNGGSIADGKTATFEVYDLIVTSSYRYADQETVRDLGYRGTITMSANWAAWDYVAEFVNLNQNATVSIPASQGGGLSDAITLPTCANADGWGFLGWEVLDGPLQGRTFASGSQVVGLASAVGDHIRLAARWRLTAADLACSVLLVSDEGAESLLGDEFDFEARLAGQSAVACEATNDADGQVSLHLTGLSLDCGNNLSVIVSQREGTDDGIVYDLELARAVLSLGGTPTTPALDVRYAKPSIAELALEPAAFVNRTIPQPALVEFDPNCDDAEGEMEDLEVAWGESFTFPASSYVRELFDFVGWNEEPDGSGAWHMAGDRVDDASELLLSDGPTVFFAQWEAKQLSIVVPAALHFVADEQGVMSGPTDGVACIANLGETRAELNGAYVEPFDPWVLVGEGRPCQQNEFALGMRLGNDGDRLDLAELDGSRLHLAWLDAKDSLYLNDLTGHAGFGGASDANVGCIHWHFRAAKASETA